MSQESLVVKAHRPWRYRIIIALLFAAALAAVAYAYVRGLNDGGYFHGESQARMERLEQSLEESREMERALGNQVAVLERAQEVDQAARETLRQEVMTLQDEIHGLREELAFYRGIVSPEDGQSGLQIQDFAIHTQAEPRTYRYSLTLIQALSHDRQVEGQVSVEIHGRQDGEARVLSLEEIASSGNKAFSFRYFQHLDGRLELPADFEPVEVLVTASQEGRSDGNLEERFEWPESEG
ncbi:hypothetical protein J2T60_002481 [Natronospira proteinivora]|uniref:Uncharacterized protein n=1 Tax=Natronospira proteinivora TaxID=1807133 RepID=A0ABT1GAX6_9GAMM|nr:DUF6776 family protein [Natronospira proteinivora]MCP1728481.1 hypothetical protein [Natronospira proteinivora]